MKYPEDLTGIKFNRYTVIERDFSKNREYWLCRCDCGEIRSVRTDGLKSGASRSCGCYHREKVSVAEDISGQKFGQLLVIEKDNERSHWKCLCDCGNYTTVYIGHLKCGNTKSCGCFKPIVYDDLTGYIFNRLTVIEIDKSNVTKEAYWICICECGNTTSCRASHLKSGNIQSCGCYKIESHITHGLTNTPLYRRWSEIKSRCYNENYEAYKYYGERGISMYYEWIDNPVLFIEYVTKLENYQKEGYTIDRINVNGNYEPGNLRWATMQEQAQNKRNNVINLEIAGEIKRLSSSKSSVEIANMFNINSSVVYSVLQGRSWTNG